MDTGGAPLRVFTSGLPPIEGRTVLDKRRYFREHHDHIRTGTMWEPRGNADMYGVIVTPAIEGGFNSSLAFACYELARSVPLPFGTRVRGRP
jgi:proline racemase